MIRRLLLAGLLLVLGVASILFARDTWHWQRAVNDADARAAVGAVGADAWQADATLPAGVARRALGLDDDLEFRRAVVLASRIGSVSSSTKSRKLRATAEAALARIVHGDSDRARASRAADYLGVLLYTDPSSPEQSVNPYADPTQPGGSTVQQTPEQKSAAELALAVKIDPNNANAKRNLEALLQQPTAPTQKGTPRPGGGDRVGNRGSGARPPGRGY